LRHLPVLAIAFWVGAADAAAQIEILLSDDSPVYTETAQALQEQLAGSASVAVTNLAESGTGRPAEEAALAIAVGSRALAAALESQRRLILAIAVTRESYERALRTADRQPAKPGTISAIFLDQPPARQLNLIRLLLPGKRRVGVLAATDNEAKVRVLESLAPGHDLTLVTETVSAPQEVYSALKSLLPRTDLLLAVPDPTIYNSATLHNIMLAAFKARQPVIACSPTFARAGAVATIYTSNAQFFRQAAGIALRALRHGALPPPDYPREFELVVNSTAAAALGLSIEDAAIVRSRLQALERER